MSGKYQRYPAYKASGVDWLGDVPEHWEVWRLSHAFEQIGSGTTPKSDATEYYEGGTIAWVNTGDLNDGELFDCEKKVTELALRDCSSLKIFPENSLVIAMYGATIGKLALLRFEATVNQACCVFCDGSLIQSKFLFYSFIGVRQHIVSLATGGGQPNISQDILRSLKLSAPEKTEQQRISNFLDHETTRIDRLIEKQRRLIELLKEKRQAVISHAVTKGLNPNAPMKDSGVEWLGEVPEHWEIGCLKRFSEIIDCKHFTVKFIDDGLPIVSIREVRDDTIDLSNANMTSKSEWNFLREGRIPKLGDLIFCRNASVGAVGYVDFDTPFCMGQDVCLIRPEIASRYIHYQLTSVLIRNQIEAFLIGATIRRANVEEIRNLFVIYPPEDEQHLITNFLNHKTEKMNSLILKSQNAIELMQERRTALISSAVTGKIDVRNWQTANKEAAA